MKKTGLAALLAGIALIGCELKETATEPSTPVPAPIKVTNGYEEAGNHKADHLAPAKELPGIHNVRWLGKNVVSGSEPHGKPAFEALAAMGVKTIVSVDGKVPDEALAATHGMRYVHIPIRYNGITPEAALRMAKVFRELDGPFFVHCFHGRHRGPAAAMIGRFVLDGIPRGQALAEMRACGTGKKYEGLYQAVASLPVPAAAQSGSLKWDFPAAQPLGSFAQNMVTMTRHYDHLKALADRDWKPDPAHPDIDARNEAEKLLGLLQRVRESAHVKGKSADFQDGMDASLDAAKALRKGLDGEGATKALRTVKQSCNACHAAFRNE